MISISSDANPNYLAKIVEIKESDWREHPNADRLKCVTIDFQNVITGRDAQEGLYVYFPVESCINESFLAGTNSFREKEFNADKEGPGGFFEKKGRVKALRLRGEPSCGYILPIKVLEDFYKVSLKEFVGEEFDTINNTLLLKKYEVFSKQSLSKSNQGKVVKKFNRIIDNQVRLHVDTENLRRNAHKIDIDERVSISYKIHGTSGWLSNVLVRKRPKWYQKLLAISPGEKYDYIYGSRKVVKNKYVKDPKNKNHFYEYDIWESVAKDITLPKGYSIYFEISGYTQTGGYIQKDFDYGCKPGENRVDVYRVTFTNPEGIVIDLTTEQAERFCTVNNLNFVPILYVGSLRKWAEERHIEGDIKDVKDLVPHLEKAYNEKDCYMCMNKVPEEGVIVRKETVEGFQAYKLKSMRFLEKETKDLDNESED